MGWDGMRDFAFRDGRWEIVSVDGVFRWSVLVFCMDVWMYGMWWDGI